MKFSMMLDLIEKFSVFCDWNLPVPTSYKPTETLQFTHFASCHPPGIKYGCLKGKQKDFLELTLPKKHFEGGRLKFKQRLKEGGYPENVKERSLLGSTLSLDNRPLNIHKS